LIHFSAIGADANSKIPYARTKALGEAAVFDICPNATIIRPSIVFGPGDGFFEVIHSFFIIVALDEISYVQQRFSRLVRFLPAGFWRWDVSFSASFCGDIANAVEIISRDDNDVHDTASGKIIEAGGPEGKRHP
jgi:NADH dehydrogenase